MAQMGNHKYLNHRFGTGSAGSVNHLSCENGLHTPYHTKMVVCTVLLADKDSISGTKHRFGSSYCLVPAVQVSY